MSVSDWVQNFRLLDSRLNWSTNILIVHRFYTALPIPFSLKQDLSCVILFSLSVCTSSQSPQSKDHKVTKCGSSHVEVIYLYFNYVVFKR